MRYISLRDFEKLVNQFCEDDKLIIKILKANNIEYVAHAILEFGLDDDKLNSLLEMNNWGNNEHCAIYKNYIYKSRNVGRSGININNSFCSIILINNINLEQFINIFKKTMELKAFL